VTMTSTATPCSKVIVFQRV
jgi:hypothetical protein